MAKKPNQLTPELRKEIAEVAAQVAIEQFRKEAERNRKAIRDRRLHNTKLLLEKYRGFVEHSRSAVYEASQLNDDADFESLMGELMSSDSVFKMPVVKSIQESAAHTRIIVQHIERMIDYYKMRCENSSKPEDMRRFRVVYGLYIAPKEKTAQELAEEECVDITTIYRDLRAALKQLSALIFGYFE